MHMKFNKKIIVASLSTVMGLSIVGAITGTVAWYQYSTRSTVSLVGTSTGNSGLLQISKTGAANSWVTNLDGSDTGSTNNNKLSPVTFGALKADGSLESDAFTLPEYGKAGYSDWLKATKGKQYLQYDIYLRSVKIKTNGDEELVARDVYLSDITIADADPTDDRDASGALRVHLDVDGGQKILISKDGTTNLPLFGKLDLDGDTEPDTVPYVFDEHYGEEIIYGQNEKYQNADSIDDWEAERNPTTGEFEDDTKVICTTSDDPDADPVKITVTIWLEGWEELTPYASPSEITAIWDITKTADTLINIGLTFDVGRNAFID